MQAKSLCSDPGHSIDYIFTSTQPGICTSNNLDSFDNFSNYCVNILLLSQAHETLKKSLLPIGTAYPAMNMTSANRCAWLSNIGITEC